MNREKYKAMCNFIQGFGTCVLLLGAHLIIENSLQKKTKGE